MSEGSIVNNDELISSGTSSYSIRTEHVTAEVPVTYDKACYRINFPVSGFVAIKDN